MPEWIGITAIILGPVLAVLITRWIDNARERHERRMRVFRTLMRTRKDPTGNDHVEALNLIEIEFYQNADVIPAWKDLFRHLNTEYPRRSDEQISDIEDLKEKQRREENYQKRIGDERQRLLAKLLHAMARHLNFKIEQLEIFEGGYYPQGAVDINTEQSLIRRFFISLAAGRALLPVAVLDYSQNHETMEDLANSESSDEANKSG